jgi:hypothetical protein
MDKNKFWLGGRLFNTASPRLGAPTQCKARPQDGRPNATQGMSASCAPQRKSATQTQGTYATQGTSARPQIGRPSATQGTSARWAPKRKTDPQRKHPHKRELGQKTSWRMDKKKFCLGGRLFNTTSPRLGAPTQRRACQEVGRPNATQGTFASWAPQRTSATQTQGTSAHPQLGRPNATEGTSASWAPKHNARRVRKMGAQTKNSSAMITSTQGSTRQKDELEDG